MSKERWLIGLVGLGAILGMALYGSVLVTDRNREAAVAKLKAKGAAVIDLHRPALDTSKAQASDKAAASKQSAERRRTAPSGEDTIAAFKILFERRKAMQSDPAWDEALEIIGKAKPKEWSAVDRAKVAEALATNQDIIRELIRLADLGGPMYELDYSKGFAMELPHLAQMRDFARLLAADAALRAGDGDYARSVEDLLAGMKLATALEDEPILISQLVRIAMDGIMLATVEQAIQGEDLPPDLTSKIIDYASRAGGRKGFANSFSSEGFFGLEAFDSIRSGDLSRAGLASNNDWSTDAVLLRLYGSGIARPLLNIDEESYADIMARMSDAARLPFYDAKPLLDQINKEIGDLPYTRFLSRTLLPAWTRAAESQAANEARLDLMRVGLAVEQYHARTGGYPETLDAVASTVGGSVPLDPFTGRPYGYQPSGAGFVLYSAIGSAVDLSGSSNRRGADENGNFVWRGRH